MNVLPVRFVLKSFKPATILRYLPPILPQRSNQPFLSNNPALTFTRSIMTVPEHLLADKSAPFCQLEIKPHFEALADEEKIYAHYISRASFHGTRIILRQVSPESEPLFDFILKISTFIQNDFSTLASAASITKDEASGFLAYASQFLSNLGNFKSFGDVKFVPRVSPDVFAKIAKLTPETEEIWKIVGEDVFSITPASKTLLGYTEDGHVTNYYPDSPGITKKDIQDVQDTLVANGVLVEHTRLRKLGSGNFELLVASATTEKPGQEYTLPDGRSIHTKYGDHSVEMAKIADDLKHAQAAALNETEEKMMGAYVESFEEGSLEAHKESQKYWIKDIGPKVESNIGFIETYRDPSGVRAEWEGFVAMVNLERTKKFGQLVEQASTFIPRLPWTKDFEKDKFMKPDFTSLEVLSFATAGIPAGINIPNYDDIRQTLGFKNVSLGNILNAKSPSDKLTFISPEVTPLFERLRGPAFELQVGIHELLGHGTGKLLQETSPGNYNFNHSSPPISPITNKPITTYYAPGETWGGKFGAIAASYEECRAECVAMALSMDEEVLKVFGHTADSEEGADDVLYISWLQMARAGLLALEFWDPSTRKWGQAHMQARYSILRCFLSAPGLVTLAHSPDDFSDLTVHLDRELIRTEGKKAINQYLLKLHVYKSTADVEKGTELYKDMTNVGEELARYREVVMKKKLPRKQFVQGNTVLGKDGKVELKEYEASAQGMVTSWVERDV